MENIPLVTSFQPEQCSDSQTLTFQVTSDLHPEYLHSNEIDPFHNFLEVTADILILAGDCGNLHRPEQFENFLFEICKRYKYVIYVPGNHEFYHVKDVTGIAMKDLEERLTLIIDSVNSRFEGDITRLILLQRSAICIGDDLLIAGCTLWTDSVIQENDTFPSYIIKITWEIDSEGHHNITQDQYNSLHQRDLEYVENIIEYAKHHNKKLMMITHHLPTGIPFSQEERDATYSSLYYTDLERLINQENMIYWICGHIHKTFNYNVNGTQLVSNQYGKPRNKNTDFQKDFVINVDVNFSE